MQKKITGCALITSLSITVLQTPAFIFLIRFEFTPFFISSRLTYKGKKQSGDFHQVSVVWVRIQTPQSDWSTIMHSHGIFHKTKRRRQSMLVIMPLATPTPNPEKTRLSHQTINKAGVAETTDGCTCN